MPNRHCDDLYVCGRTKHVGKLGTSVALMLEVVLDGLSWEAVSALPAGQSRSCHRAIRARRPRSRCGEMVSFAGPQWYLAGSEA